MAMQQQEKQQRRLIEDQVRPQQLKDVVGSEAAVSAVRAWCCQVRSGCAPVLVLEGGTGSGKTTLARAAARELGRRACEVGCDEPAPTLPQLRQRMRSCSRRGLCEDTPHGVLMLDDAETPIM